jgi:hypothetical protein
MYRRAHCCNNVAKRAQVRLITRLKNQSELTQTAYFGGENGMDGSDSVVGIETKDPLASACS